MACPKETPEPDPPLSTPCSTHAECNPDGGAICGALVACVDGYCALEPSIALPCE
ncbi:MAG: hypothetical protein OEY14_11465 [Myxococcales bacterium]|nr:hypothetical protein [Myxococcales bacterium]